MILGGQVVAVIALLVARSIVKTRTNARLVGLLAEAKRPAVPAR